MFYNINSTFSIKKIQDGSHNNVIIRGSLSVALKPIFRTRHTIKKAKIGCYFSSEHDTKVVEGSLEVHYQCASKIQTKN